MLNVERDNPPGKMIQWKLWYLISNIQMKMINEEEHSIKKINKKMIRTKGWIRKENDK